MSCQEDQERESDEILLHLLGQRDADGQTVLHLAANPRHCELEAVVRADAGLLPWKVFAATLVSAMVTGIGLLLAFADAESGSFDGSLGALDVWLAGTALLVVVCFACHGWRPVTHDATMEAAPPACLDMPSDRQATSATRCGSSLPQRHRWLRHRDESTETNELVRADDDGVVASQRETGEEDDDDDEDEIEEEEKVAEDAERGAPRMQVGVSVRDECASWAAGRR